MNEDVKIVKDLKILQQIFSHIPSTGNAINIVCFQTTVERGKTEIPYVKNKGEIVFGLEELIESLPQPRLKNLIEKVIDMSRAKFKTDKEAANWLGGSVRLVNYRRRKQTEQILLETEDK